VVRHDVICAVYFPMAAIMDGGAGDDRPPSSVFDRAMIAQRVPLDAAQATRAAHANLAHIRLAWRGVPVLPFELEERYLHLD
jgi:hypothetical protein